MTSLEIDALWTVAEAAENVGVSEDTVRKWAQRGHLPLARNHDGEEIRDPHGRPRFHPADVAEAEYRTRKRARRIVGCSESCDCRCHAA